jgi:hypothetical protein
MKKLHQNAISWLLRIQWWPALSPSSFYAANLTTISAFDPPMYFIHGYAGPFAKFIVPLWGDKVVLVWGCHTVPPAPDNTMPARDFEFG